MSEHRPDSSCALQRLRQDGIDRAGRCSGPDRGRAAGQRRHPDGLADAGIEVTEVADYTGQPEILGGRVKTLHPKIHAGILARRDVPDDLAALEQQGFSPIDLVVVNLYPFEATIARPARASPTPSRTSTSAAPP